MDKITDFEKVDSIISKYSKEHGTLIPILQESQGHYGYLSEELMKYIAIHTQTPASTIYGIATFYSQFRLSPIGKNIIRICNGTACHVANVSTIKDAVLDHLNVKEDETTEDGKFTVELVACLGCCSLAPVVMINDSTYGRLTPDKIRKILSKYPNK